MSKRRVVVTGLGIISPVGNDVATAWANIVGGRSGIGPITHFDASTFPTRIAGEIRDFDPTEFVAAKDVKKMDPFIHYGIAASVQALSDAGLKPHEHDEERIGVAVGAGIGGIATIEKTAIHLSRARPAQDLAVLRAELDHQHGLGQPVDHARPEGTEHRGA